MPIVYKAFFEHYSETHQGHGTAGHHEEIRENPFMAIPLCFTAAATFVLGTYPDFILNLAREVLK